MNVPGHTLQLATQDDGRECVITLECQCRAVFARGVFAVDDAVNRQTVRDEGWEAARAHLRGQGGIHQPEAVSPQPENAA